MQFLRLKSRALELASTADPLKEMMISESGFRNALHMIDIGQNDISDSFSKGLSYSQVVKQIPNVVSEIKSAIKVRAFTYRSRFQTANYGFEKPLMACCGNRRPPCNYNVNITCGHGGSNSCNEGSRCIRWDGIHYTETANAIVALKVLLM